MSFETQLHTKTLDIHPQGLAIKGILSSALEAAEPEKAVHIYLKKEKGSLRIEEERYALKDIQNIYLIAFGKAAPAMASATCKILGKLISGGIISSKYPSTHNLNNLNNLEIHLAGHPVPDKRSLTAGEKILKLLSKTTKKDLVLFMISGGGSALITAPVRGLSLSDLQNLTSLLLESGARIDEINTLRRALDRIKGGGLAQAAFPAQIASLILSDVVDSPLEAIASGPTVPNPTTNADALKILKKYNLLKKIPGSIIDILNKKQDDLSKISTGKTLIIGSNRISAEAARDKAVQVGFKAQILTTSLQGEAAEKGKELARHLLALKEHPLCIIVGGETTVTLGNASGLGGRNQEMALSVVEEMSGSQDKILITLATDGDDGPTDAAGAVVNGETLKRAKLLGFNARAHLYEHNAYPFFDALDDLLKPGPTGTNVNDLTFLFSF